MYGFTYFNFFFFCSLDFVTNAVVNVYLKVHEFYESLAVVENTDN